MLNRFRKIKKVCVAMITIMLLLPVQQSFSQSLNHMASFTLEESSLSSSMNMEHCQSSQVTSDSDTKTKLSSESQQQDNCCDTNDCDSSHCSISISFIALLPNSVLINSYQPQQHELTVEQFEIRVLPSELFRPPRTIQI